jgi:acyl carrier protein
MNISKFEFVKILKDNADKFDKDDIYATDVLSELGVDSLGFVMTIYAIEEKLNIKIDDEDLKSLTSTSTVADFVKVLAALDVNIEL